MFILGININHFNALHKVGKEKLENFITSVHEIIIPGGGETSSEGKGLLVYHFPDNLAKSPNSFLILINEIKKIIEKHQSFLAGYSLMILFRQSWNQETINNQLIDFLYQIPKDCQIWFSQRAFLKVKGYLKVKKTADIFQFVEINNLLEKQNSKLIPFILSIANQEVIQALQEKAAEQPKSLILVNNACENLHNNQIMQEIKKWDKKTIAISIDIYNKEEDSFYPIEKAFKKDFWNKVSLYLNKTQKEIWLRIEPYLYQQIIEENKIIFSDKYYRDLICGFKLFLAAYAKYQSRYNHIPLLIINNLHNLNKEKRENYLKLLSGIISENLFNVVIYTKEDLNKEFEERYDAQKINLNPTQIINNLKKEEIKGLIEADLSENKVENNILEWYHQSILNNNKAITNLSLKKEEKHKDQKTASQILLNYFDPLSWQLLYCIHLLPGFFSRKDIVSFFIDLGNSPFVVKNNLDLFLNLHFIIDKDKLYPALDNIKPLLEELLSKQAKILNKQAADYLFRISGKFHNEKQLLLIRFFWSNLETKKSLIHYINLLSIFLESNNLKCAQHLLYHDDFQPEKLANPEYKGTIRHIKKIFILLYQFYCNQEELDIQIEENISCPDQQIQSEVNAITFIILSTVEYKQHYYDKSLRHAKQALFEFQRTANLKGMSQANLIIGLNFLSRERIKDALHYLEIASDQADESKFAWERIKCHSQLAICYFLYGNCSAAIKQAKTVLDICEKTGAREWQIYALFIIARINMETAYYSESIQIIKKGIKMASFYRLEKAVALFQRWLARNLIYTKEYEKARELLEKQDDCPEKFLFLAELAFCRKDFKQGLDEIKKGFTEIPGEMPYLNRINWKDGFEGMEKRYLGTQKDISLIQYKLKVFESYFKTKLNIEKSFSELEALSNSQLFSRYNPDNKIVYFLLAQLIGSGNGIDRLTALNKANKTLQEYCSHTDDPQSKAHMLKKNYWNSMIIAEAEKQKMI